jgi:hypothetical protein
MRHQRESCDAPVIWRNSRARQGNDTSVVLGKREDFLLAAAAEECFLVAPDIPGRPRSGDGVVPVTIPKRDEIRMNRHRASGSCLGMISSENRCTLFRIMP